MTEQQAMRLALEALEEIALPKNAKPIFGESITALRQALEQQPAAREPLTDEVIIEWVESGEYNVVTNDWASHIAFARAIEAAHGITTPQQKDTP